MAHEHLTAMLDRLVADWLKERPDLEIEHKEVVYAIYILRSLFTQNADEVLARWELNFNSYGVLATLRRAGAPFELGQTELAQALGFTPGGMSNLLTRLELQNLVTRTPSTEDKRSVRVRLTPSGRRTADEAATAVTASEGRYFEVLTETERRRLYKILRCLIGAFAKPQRSAVRAPRARVASRRG